MTQNTPVSQLTDQQKIELYDKYYADTFNAIETALIQSGCVNPAAITAEQEWNWAEEIFCYLSHADGVVAESVVENIFDTIGMDTATFGWYYPGEVDDDMNAWNYLDD